MNKRIPVKKSVRFEVFKRDSFTCQYCGRQAPGVVLDVDHIQPVAKDGTNDLMNLITPCRDCNAGKGVRELSDDAALAKRKQQLDELQERREQLEMMLEWQRGLVDLEGVATDEVARFWTELVVPYHLTDIGMKLLRKLLQKFGATEVMECMRIARDQYLKTDDNGVIIPESVDKTWDMVGRIAGARQAQKNKPYMRELYMIRGMMRNRFNYCNEWRALAILENAHCYHGVPVEELRLVVSQSKNWTQWNIAVEELCLVYGA